MTRKEAIEFLDNIKQEELGRGIGASEFYSMLIGYHVQALNMAIKELESGGLKTVKLINKYGEECGELYFDQSRQLLFNGCIAIEALKANGFTILPS